MESELAALAVRYRYDLKSGPVGFVCKIETLPNSRAYAGNGSMPVRYDVREQDAVWWRRIGAVKSGNTHRGVLNRHVKASIGIDEAAVDTHIERC